MTAKTAVNAILIAGCMLVSIIAACGGNGTGSDMPEIFTSGSGGLWERRNSTLEDCEFVEPNVIALWLMPDGSGRAFHGDPGLGWDTVDIDWSYSGNQLTIDFDGIGAITYSVVFGTYNNGEDRNMDMTPIGVINACMYSMADIEEWVW